MSQHVVKFKGYLKKKKSWNNEPRISRAFVHFTSAKLTGWGPNSCLGFKLIHRTDEICF